MLLQATRSIDAPNQPSAASSLKVPAGPRKATRMRRSSARQADMISRQIGATLSDCSGPGLAAFRPSMTWASRSGRKTTPPVRFFSSPTSSARPARRFSSASNSRSTLSMRVRSACSATSASSGAALIYLLAALAGGLAAGFGGSPAGAAAAGAPSAARTFCSSACSLGSSTGRASATSFCMKLLCISPLAA